jgi:hypothetical protein
LAFRLIRVRSNALWHGGKKNDDGPLPVKNLDQLIDWKQEYENLRQEALQAGSRRGHGLALFLSHGMMAWLEALTALRSHPVSQRATQESFDLPSVLRPDLTTLLTNMVLSCMRGEVHDHIQ